MMKAPDMISGSLVFYKIASICLLVFVGFIARRMKLVPENSLSALSCFILDIATPCYLLTNMIQTVSAETLAASWTLPLLGFVLIAFSDLIGRIAAHWWSPPAERSTFRLVAGAPNWVFLGMAVCGPLFGAPGVRVVLLFNFSITMYIWTAGTAAFRRGLGGGAVKELFFNPQILATMAGVVLASTAPFLATVHGMAAETLAALPPHLGLAAMAWEAVELLGITALPLSIFQIGLRMAGSRESASREKQSGYRSLLIASAVRLLATPALCMGLLYSCARLGLALSEPEFVSAAVIMSLPTAVAALAIAEVYGGSTLLAARGVLWMTVASMATVPAMTLLAQHVYSWL